MPQRTAFPLLPTIGLLVAASTFTLIPTTGYSDEQELLKDIRQLTFAGRRAGEGYFNADGSLMIFQSERLSGNPFYQIFLLDMESGDIEQISPGYGKTTCAWIHPNNRQVLYASTHHDSAARAKMQAELDFRASGNTRRYAWDYDPAFDIYSQDLNSGERVNLTDILGYDAEGAYSPDGSLIVFASNRHAYSEALSAAEAKRLEHDKSYFMDLYLMDADGGSVRRLTTAPGYDGGPFFSADGRHIVWRRFSADGATAEVFTLDLTTGEERQITRTGVMAWAPFFHPSGDYIVFTSNREGFANFELFIVDAQGLQEPVRVTYSEGFDGLASFAPDGERLTWTSNRTSDRQSQIFIADWDDAKARALLGLDELESGSEPTPATQVLAQTDATIRATDARHHVTALTDPALAGRLTGSDGERRATAYVAEVFKQLGLAPQGDNGSYFQSFPFTAGVTLGENNQLALTGTPEPLTPALDVDWRPLALSTSAEELRGEVVFAGYGIVAPPSQEVPAYDSYGDLDVEGKWVMMLRFLPEEISPEQRRHLSYFADLGYKAAVAKRRGALGLIVVTGPNARPRDRLVPLAGDVSATASLPGFSISDDLAAQLLATADVDLQEHQTQLDSGAGAAGFALPAVTVTATLELQREQRRGRNVIASLTAEPPSAAPALVIGAHIDHLGRGEMAGSLARDEERGQIHVGADDNASGVAGLLEIAQYLSAQKRLGKLDAKRDIIFAAWSGEEIGILGSSHFAAQLTRGGRLSERVAAYLNLDMIGRLRQTLYLQGTGSSERWEAEIEQRNVPIGLSITLQADPYLPTDSTPFYLNGVPILTAFTGAHEDYSTPRDTADKLNYEGIRDIARLMGGIARSLARSPTTPNYQEVTRQSSDIGRRHLRAYLGTIPAYGQGEAVQGVALQGAIKDGPAAQAGIEEGDILVALDGIAIATIQDFMAALAGLKVGEETEMTVIRNGETLVLPVVPGSRE